MACTQQKIKDFLLKNFLIIGLVLVIIIGLVFPETGLYLQEHAKYGPFGLPNLAVVVIFICSGVCLDSVRSALQPIPLSLGITLVMGITPLTAIPVMYVSRALPQLNILLIQGMALFCVVPTTLSSGITMVTQARGNVSLAILLTVVTNIVGVFTMPFTVSYIFSSTKHLDLHPLSMLWKLMLQTLTPLLFGMSLRQFIPAVQKFATQHKKPFGLTQNTCVLIVVWLMMSAAQSKIVSTPLLDILVVLVLANLVHVVFRVVAALASNLARLPEREWVTIVLMGSQKSLPVSVSVLSALPALMQPETGILIVPCIMAHASQLVIDSMLAVRWQIPEDVLSKELFV
jgi:sodium/bile acid cotransporter 7